MPLSHHPLVAEFPEYRERIHQLKMDDRHFHRLMDEYEALDKEIFRHEDGEEPMDDAALEVLKKKRLALKDDLYQILQKN